MYWLLLNRLLHTHLEATVTKKVNGRRRKNDLLNSSKKTKQFLINLLLSRRFGSNALFHFHYSIYCSFKCEKKISFLLVKNILA